MFQIIKIIIGNLHLFIEALHNKPKPCVKTYHSQNKCTEIKGLQRLRHQRDT